MNPKAFLQHTEQMAKRMIEMREKAVFVGLPKEKVGGQVYGDGMTVLRIGAIHEYGAGDNPQRSFLRVPFRTKRTELNKSIAKQFEAVSNGQKTDIGLGRIGAIATNISKGAFGSSGYGEWTDITPETKRRKGSSQPLIDTGILKGSINWVIRDAT